QLNLFNTKMFRSGNVLLLQRDQAASRTHLAQGGSDVLALCAAQIFPSRVGDHRLWLQCPLRALDHTSPAPSRASGLCVFETGPARSRPGLAKWQTYGPVGSRVLRSRDACEARAGASH